MQRGVAYLAPVDAVAPEPFFHYYLFKFVYNIELLGSLRNMPQMKYIFNWKIFSPNSAKLAIWKRNVYIFNYFYF